MKTKDDVIKGFLERHCALLMDVYPKAYNSIKSQLFGIWKNGFRHGVEDGIKQGAELAAMHGADATSKQLNDAFFDGVAETLKKNDQYQLGMRHAWDLARKLIDMNQADISNLLSREIVNFREVLEDDVLEVKELFDSYIEARKQLQDVHVGDEVITDTGTVVVTHIYLDDYINGVDSEGRLVSCPIKHLKRTGKSYPQIKEVLKELEGKNEKKQL